MVQLNIAGQVVGMEQSQYASLLNALIPPRGEGQIRIEGPGITALQEGTLGVFLYDVVTATDDAGNVQGRENFEWFFNVAADTIRSEQTVPRGEVWLTNAVAADARADGGPCLEGVRR